VLPGVLQSAMARDPTAPACGCVGVVVGDWRGDKRLEHRHFVHQPAKG
jgi:hypothetical protein